MNSFDSFILNSLPETKHYIDNPIFWDFCTQAGIFKQVTNQLQHNKIYIQYMVTSPSNILGEDITIRSIKEIEFSKDIVLESISYQRFFS